MRFFVILFLISGSVAAQKSDVYTKRGNAIEGYDVVSYFSNTPKKGDKSISAEHQGNTYLFSSEENKELFLASPEKYLPEYGGYCAYAIATKGKKVKIDPETFEIRDDKLYLFYNAWGTNTLTLWLNDDPQKLVSQANKNWAKQP